MQSVPENRPLSQELLDVHGLSLVDVQLELEGAESRSPKEVQDADRPSESDSEDLKDSESLGSASAESLSDSESEPGLETHETDVFSGVELHGLHMEPEEPISLPGCRIAQQYADTAADSDHELCCSASLQCSIAQGKLQVSRGDITNRIPLVWSEAAASSPKKGRSVIAIVPDGISELSRSSSASSMSQKSQDLQERRCMRRLPSEVQKCWLLTCPSCSAKAILDLLGTWGCRRSDLRSHYAIDDGGLTAKGGHGIVKSAHRLHDRREERVAVKLMSSHVRDHHMRNEVKMLVEARDHQGIVKLLAVFVDHTSVKAPRHRALVFEYYDKDLHERVLKGRRIRQHDAMRYLRDILGALKYVHGKGIFHRDVKPNNLLVARNDHLVLADFGVAVFVSDRAGMEKKSYTIGFAAPEMLTGTASGPEGDAFGAGVVLYFMLTKLTPFIAPTADLMADRTKSCNINLDEPAFEDVTEDCKRLLLGLTCKEAKDRLTVDKALEFRCVLASLASTTTPELPAMSTPKARRGPVQSKSDLDVFTVDNTRQRQERTVTSEDSEFDPPCDTSSSEEREVAMSAVRKGHAAKTLGELPSLFG